jgi:hypothetical protein
MSSIAAGTTSGTALVSTANTDGTIQLQVNGTTPSVTLAANGSLGVGSTPAYGTNGQVLTSAGTGSAPTWTTVSAGLAAASQAEMEAASSNTVAVTPLATKWSPAASKAWIKIKVTGGVPANSISLNVASITDVGVGNCSVTLTTGFSSVNYVVLCSIDSGGNADVASPDVRITSATVFYAEIHNNSNVGFDPREYWFATFGDQS